MAVYVAMHCHASINDPVQKFAELMSYCARWGEKYVIKMSKFGIGIHFTIKIPDNGESREVSIIWHNNHFHEQHKLY